MEGYISSLSSEQKNLLSTVQNRTCSDVKSLLKRLPNLIEDPTFSYVLLVAALHRKDESICTLLVKKGCTVMSSFKTNYYNTPLYYAILKDDVKLFKKLYRKGASIHDTDANSETPLELAAVQHQNPKYLDLILHEQNYDNINPECKEDVALFHVACYRGRVEIMKKFLDRNFSVNSRSNFRQKGWSGGTPIQLALEGCWTNAVKFLLQFDIDFNIQDEGGNTILHSAIEKFDKDFSKPSDPLLDDILRVYVQIYDETKYSNPTNQYGLSHFHILCSVNWDDVRSGDESAKLLNLLKYFIEKGVDINSSSHFEGNEDSKIPYYAGYTALHWAAQKSNLSILKLLLEEGSDVTKIDALGNTPLHVLDFKNVNSFKMAELLLKYGANVDVKNLQGDTPLHCAFYAQKRNKALIELLLSASCGTSDHVNSDGLSYLHIASSADIGRVKTLIENGASVTNRVESRRGDFCGYSALHFAVISNKAEIVEYLLLHGAEVNPSSRRCETTALHLACTEQLMHLNETFDDEKAVRTFPTILLTVPADCDNYENPAWVESRKNQTLIIEMLLEHGASLDTLDVNRMTPLFAVCDFLSLVESSDSYIEYDSSTHEEVLNRQKIIVDILLRRGADINSRGYSGRTLLHVLFEKSDKDDNRIDLAEFLLERGADVDAVDHRGFTPLNFAVMESTYLDDGENLYQNDPDFIDLFLEYGANINSRSHDTSTPLHTATSYLHPDKDREEIYVKLLNHPDVDIDARDKIGETPLHVAVARCRLYCVKKLLDAGADVNIENACGHTPIFPLRLIRKGPQYDYRYYRNIMDICATIIKHVKKLLKLNHFVSEKVSTQLKDIEKNSWINFSRTDSLIDEEVKKLKSVKVDKYTSLFEILMKSPNDMVKHAKNEIFGKIVSSAQSREDFPQFFSFLKRQYMKGLSRSLILESAKEALRIVTKTDWPDSCSEHILKSLSNDNLESLRKSISVGESCRRSQKSLREGGEPRAKVPRVG